MTTQPWLDVADGAFSFSRRGPTHALDIVDAPLSRLTADGAAELEDVGKVLRSLSLSGRHFPTDALDGAAVRAAAGGVTELSVNGTSLAEDELVGLLTALEALRKLDVAGTALGEEALRGLLPRLGQLTHLALGYAPPRPEHRFTPAIRDGRILPLLNGLQGLESLSLRALAVGDEVAQLEIIKGLASLDLGETRITNVTMRALAGCPGMSALRVDNTAVDDEGLVAVAAGATLSSLDLAGTGVSDEGLAALAGQRQLKRLNLAETSVSDASAAVLATLTGLQILDLSSTQVGRRTVEALAAVPALAELDLGGQRIDVIAPLRDLRSLRSLKLGLRGQVPWPAVADLDALEELAAPAGAGLKLPPRLRRYIATSDVQADWIAGLAETQGLEALGFYGEGAGHLTALAPGALPQLRDFFCPASDFTDETLRWLAAAPAIEALYISGSPVTSAGLAALADMAFLHTLEIRDVRLEPATARLIAGLSRLHCLDVPGTGFTDAEVELLAAAPNLQSLALDPGQITERSMTALGGAKALSELYIYGADVSAETFGLVAWLAGLVELNLVNAELVDEMVDTVASLPRLRILRAGGDGAVLTRLAQLRPDLLIWPEPGLSLAGGIGAGRR
jgi:internalin A